MRIIKKEIAIHAPAAKVREHLTDPKKIVADNFDNGWNSRLDLLREQISARGFTV